MSILGEQQDIDMTPKLTVVNFEELKKHSSNVHLSSPILLPQTIPSVINRAGDQTIQDGYETQLDQLIGELQATSSLKSNIADVNTDVELDRTIEQLKEYERATSLHNENELDVERTTSTNIHVDPVELSEQQQLRQITSDVKVNQGLDSTHSKNSQVYASSSSNNNTTLFNTLLEKFHRQLKNTETLIQQNEQETTMINKQLLTLQSNHSLAGGRPFSNISEAQKLLSSSLIKRGESERVTEFQEDEELKMIRLNHLKEMERIRFEQERLTQEKELLDLKKQIEKEKEQQRLDEERRQQEKLEEQKRQARIRREKAKEAGFSSFNQSSSDDDLKKQAFHIYFDYVVGLPFQTQSVALVYAIYDCETNNLKAPVRRTPITETDIISSDSPNPDSKQPKHSIFLIRRQYPREILRSTHQLKMIVELLSVIPSNESPTTHSIGWTIMHITSDQLQFNEGCFKLPVFFPHVDASLQAHQLDKYYKRVPGVELFVRLVTPASFRSMEAFPVTLETQDQYMTPNNVAGKPISTLNQRSLSLTPENRCKAARGLGDNLTLTDSITSTSYEQSNRFLDDLTPLGITSDNTTISTVDEKQEQLYEATSPLEHVSLDTTCINITSKLNEEISILKRDKQNDYDEGFVLHIDGAEFLPENVLFSRVKVYHCTADFCPLNSCDIVYQELESPCLNPSYNYSKEFIYNRMNGNLNTFDSTINPTIRSTFVQDDLFVVMQLETVDSNMQTRVVGYSLLEVYKSKLLALGEFKLPLYVISSSLNGELDNHFDLNSPVFPCSSLYVRITAKAKGETLDTESTHKDTERQLNGLYSKGDTFSYSDLGERKYINKQLQIDIREQIAQNMSWKTARHVLENITTKNTQNGEKLLYEASRAIDCTSNHQQDEILLKRMKTLFDKKNTATILATPYIDQIGLAIVPEAIVIDLPQPPPCAMWFLITKVFLVEKNKGGNEPDLILSFCCEEVDWDQSKLNLFVWKDQPIIIRNIAKKGFIDIVVEHSVCFVPKYTDKIHKYLGEGKIIHLTTNTTNEPTSAVRTQSESIFTDGRGLERIAKLFRYNNARRRLKEVVMNMSLNELKDEFNGRLIKHLIPSGRSKKQPEVFIVGWTMFSAFVDGKLIGLNDQQLVRSGRFVAPLISGTVPQMAYSMLQNQMSINQILNQFISKDPHNIPGAIYFWCYDMQRHAEFEWLKNHDSPENTARFARYTPSNYADSNYFYNIVASKNAPILHQYLEDLLVDAYEAAQMDPVKWSIVNQVRHQVLKGCYEALIDYMTSHGLVTGFYEETRGNED